MKKKWMAYMLLSIWMLAMGGCGTALQESGQAADATAADSKDKEGASEADAENHTSEATDGSDEAASSDAEDDPVDAETGDETNVTDASDAKSASEDGTDEPLEDTEPTEDGDGSLRELTQQELADLTAYVQRLDTCGFLMSDYSSPEEADLGWVFYSGAGISEVATN